MQSEALSADSVLKYLQTARSKAADTSTIDKERRGAYRQAAAVLAGIRSPETLNPFGLGGVPGEAETLLKDDLLPITNRKLDGRFVLSPQVRRLALKELGSREQMIKALDANPQERTGNIQEHLEKYLFGTAVPLGEQTLEQLECSLQALLWLDGAIDGLPSVGEVSRHLDLRRMLAPFEALAGDAVFRGRQSELDELRRYIGVIPPQALAARLLDRAFRWTKPDMQPALSLYGPGGVGKSALVARFMLEHLRVREEAQLPFAYLDFDRPGLDIGDPLTLCLEMARQLYLQFPAPEFEKMHQWLTQVVEDDRRDSKPDEPQANQSNRAYGALADLVGTLESKLGPRPYVVVLDTFEEVQYRGEARAFPFWEMLQRLQQSRPFLRVVVSGRAPAVTLRLAEKSPIGMQLGSLDQEAATAFLQTQGVSDAQMAQRLVSQFGAIPLTLKLLASLLKRETPGTQEIENVDTKSRFWFSASDSVIQGQLYERILGHIHNPRVERLAYPGLVLRRVTPDVIQYVLDGPCNLAIQDRADADQLFQELRRETALVTIDDLEGALVHRADLRRVMLKLLTQKVPAQVEQIRRAAIAWYATQQGRRARAEELYHRLQLGEIVDKSAFADPEIQSSIQASISEFSNKTQLMLASFGLQIASEILQTASVEQQEAYLAEQVESHLPYGKQSVFEANQLLIDSKVLRGSEVQLDHASELYRAAARLAAQEERYDQALAIIEKGLSQSARVGATEITLGLAMEQSWLLRDRTQSEELRNSLNLLGEYAARYRWRTALVQHRIQLLSSPAASARDNRIDWIELSRLVLELQPLELWGLVPAIPSALPRLLEVQPLLSKRFRDVVVADQSPFIAAELQDRAVRSALADLLYQAYEVWNTRGPSTESIVSCFDQLARAWPYRVLYVRPPYGRQREALSESVA